MHHSYTGTIPAKPTKFNGIQYRSKTEAKWAAFFTYYKMKFWYEPQRFRFKKCCYLPDFYLPELGCWLEVKGAPATPFERLKVQLLAQRTKQNVLLAEGKIKPEIQICSWEKTEKFTCWHKKGLYWCLGFNELWLGHLEYEINTTKGERLILKPPDVISECWDIITEKQIMQALHAHDDQLNPAQNLCLST